MDEERHEPGCDLSAIALPSSLGQLTGLIPELHGADAMVDLRAVPRRAVRSSPTARGSMVGPPPEHVRRARASIKPKEPPGPPPRRVLERQTRWRGSRSVATS